MTKARHEINDSIRLTNQYTAFGREHEGAFFFFFTEIPLTLSGLMSYATVVAHVCTVQTLKGMQKHHLNKLQEKYKSGNLN